MIFKNIVIFKNCQQQYFLNVKYKFLCELTQKLLLHKTFCYDNKILKNVNFHLFFWAKKNIY